MIDGVPVNMTVNSGNQYTDGAHSGPTKIIGTVDELATVTVNGDDAIVTARPGVPGEYLFESVQKLESDGTTAVSVVATDASSNQTTSNATISTPTGDKWDFTYDDNGNTLTRVENPGGGGEISLEFDWDAQNRMIEIDDGTDVYEFTYDAIGRRMTQKLNSTTIRQYIWSGMQIVEERDGSGTLLRTYHSSGVTIETVSDSLPQGEHYFAKDHLGSIREVVSAGGTVEARYDYDPWGRREKLTGSYDIELGYTGHWLHETGVYLAPFRAYDPELGRWLSRDPIEEQGGINIYSYVVNEPLNSFDPNGLWPTNGVNGVPPYAEKAWRERDWTEADYESDRQQRCEQSEALVSGVYKQYYGDIIPLLATLPSGAAYLNAPKVTVAVTGSPHTGQKIHFMWQNSQGIWKHAVGGREKRWIVTDKNVGAFLDKLLLQIKVPVRDACKADLPKGHKGIKSCLDAAIQAIKNGFR